jgi:hypothetical protein
MFIQMYFSLYSEVYRNGLNVSDKMTMSPGLICKLMLYLL